MTVNLFLFLFTFFAICAYLFHNHIDDDSHDTPNSRVDISTDDVIKYDFIEKEFKK